MMDKMKDMKTKKRTLKKEEKKESETEYVIRAENVDYTYEGSKIKALDHLSLNIRKGKKVAVMGGNGCGKSTFFLCLNGIRRPESGRIFIDGKPIEYTKKGLLDVRRKIGIVFQNPDEQLFSASVYEEISFGILNMGADEETAEKAVRQIIEELGLSAFQEEPTHALSGGQKKQVSIADILVMKPDIIILDEPAAALDPKHTTMVNQIVNRMTKAGITVFMATHDVNYAYEWADQVILFHQGKVLMQGAPEEVFSNPHVLEKTNLEPPAVLELFHSLCQKQILKTTLPLPKNLKTLEKYISDTNINTTQ